MDSEYDVLAKYRHISNKLKKRFLKKPNVSEGSEQFSSLSKTLRQQESSQYAGFCCLAQARCEHSLGNGAGEAQALTEAARAFLESEHNSREIHSPSFQEHLSAAINCYSHAIRVHIENKQAALAAALCVELGTSLRKLNKQNEALIHFQRAAELQFQSPMDVLQSLSLVGSCKIEINDFDGALTTFTEIGYLAEERGVGSTGKPIGAFADIWTRCEITQVLLLMLLQPTPQRIRPEHAKILEKYTWEFTGEEMPGACVPDELFLLLQSVVMACQSHDVSTLKALQTELWSSLSVEQNQLLHLLIQEISKPAAEGV